MAKSVEEQVEDIFKGELKKLKVKYFTKTEPINPSIDNALKKGPSKANKDGGNFPDIKVFLETQNQRRIPVMIEVKGLKNKLIKLDKSKNIDQSTAAVTGYAVNGAVHYAKVVLQHSDYEEVIAVGLNGYKKPDGSLETEFQAFYLSRNNELYPKLLDDVTDFSLFKETNLEHLVDLLDKVNLSEEELEKLKKEAESSLEKSIQKIHQSLYDDVILKPLLNTDQKLYLFCGLIMAALPIKDVANLTPADLKGNKSARNNDGLTLYTRIEEFLKDRGTSDEKRQIILNLLGNIFNNSTLYSPTNGESKLRNLYTQVLNDIIPHFNSNLHLDFTGKIFNKLSEWANISTDLVNDVVLTPRYVTNLMAQLAQTSKDSYVLDSAMGSAGFLVSALEIMLQDAKDSISDQEALQEKIKKIKSEQICGVEILDTIFMLAVMNMVLVGDGSSNLQHSDSLRNPISFPATVFLLNPPYSADGKGFNFVEQALSKMQKGFACVLIQESAGAGNGGGYPKKILKKSSLVASIKMPVDLFSGKASVQTAIYLFEAGKPHNQDNLVTFVDFSEDGYTRMNRRKSGQDVNLRDTDDAKGRYAELVARILNKKTSTAYFTEANGKLIRDTISLTGKDWTFSQHAKPDTEPTLEDFRKTVKNYLSWKLSEIIQKESNSLGKEVEILNKPCSWRDFPLTSLFEIANTESILKSQILPSEIGIPYLTAKEGDNSIASYAVEDNNLRKDKGHCVFIGGKTLVVSFQESDFYSNDSHNLTLHLKERKDSLKEDLGLFLAGAVYKSLKPKYSWGNSISFKKIQKDTVSLPVKDNGSPDWDYMEAFIRAIKELIVTEVVKTLNKVSKPLNR